MLPPTRPRYGMPPSRLPLTAARPRRLTFRTGEQTTAGAGQAIQPQPRAIDHAFDEAGR
jgi:hypothetical protein